MKQIKLVLNGKEINLTGDNVVIKSDKFNVDKNGNLTCSNATISGGKIDIYTTRSSGDKIIKVADNQGATTYIGTVNALIGATNIGDINTGVYLQGNAGGESTVRANTLVQTSLESQKKNFEKLKEGLEIVLSTDIYKFNYKTQKDTDKKSIGFVMGKNFNYSTEITDKNESGVNLYSMTSVAFKAIQEQQEEIEFLKNKIEEMREKINGKN